MSYDVKKGKPQGQRVRVTCPNSPVCGATGTIDYREPHMQGYLPVVLDTRPTHTTTPQSWVFTPEQVENEVEAEPAGGV